MRTFLGVTVFFVLASFVYAGSQNEILEKILKVNEGIEAFQAEFVQTTCTKATKACQRFEGKLWLKRPEKFRMEVVSPDTQLFVSDGDTMWIWFPKASQAIREKSKNTQLVPQPSQVLFHFADRYEIDAKGEETVKGRVYYLLQLKPKEESPYLARATVWLNPKSFLMERLLVVDIQQNETLLEFKRVRTNSALPESTFAFTPPEGAEIVEGVGVR